MERINTWFSANRLDRRMRTQVEEYSQNLKELRMENPDLYRQRVNLLKLALCEKRDFEDMNTIQIIYLLDSLGEADVLPDGSLSFRNTQGAPHSVSREVATIASRARRERIVAELRGALYRGTIDGFSDPALKSLDSAPQATIEQVLKDLGVH